MPTVVIHHDAPIAPAIRDRLPALDVVDAETEGAAYRALGDAAIFVTNPTKWTDRFLDDLSPGSWVQATSIGYDRFPLDAFERKNVGFTTAAGIHDAVVSDHALALALALSRDVDASLSRQRAHDWDRAIGADMWSWNGRQMTVYGLGNIGEAVARRGRAFGMEVYGVKRTPATYSGVLGPDHVVGPADAMELFPETDLLVLTVPLTDATHHAIDEAVFRTLPDSTILVNVARGSVVDQEALSDALAAGELAGAGLDVFEDEPLPESSPLWGLDNVLITPHIGGRSADFPDRFADLFAENYRHWTADEPLENRLV